jgi:hypothetical protein
MQSLHWSYWTAINYKHRNRRDERLSPLVGYTIDEK